MRICQVLLWLYRRYIRYMVAGAILSCLAVNVTLHLGAGLRYLCEEDCMGMLMQGMGNTPDVVNHIRNTLLDPGAPRGSYKPPHDILNPPWAKLGQWLSPYLFLQEIFGSRYTNFSGRYMEIGAQDGEFMSLTAFLEKKRNFDGLLVEPNPAEYRKLRGKKRRAMSINACVTPSFTAKKQLWVKSSTSSLPPMLQKVHEGSSRLFDYVANEDKPLGSTVTVQCFPLATLARAAFRSSIVDLIVISTNGGELDIITASDLSELAVWVMVVVTPLIDEDDVQFLKDRMRRINMEFHSSTNQIHIFLRKGPLVYSADSRDGQ